MKTLLILFTLILFSGCNSITYEKDLIIRSAGTGSSDKTYKYSYGINAYPSDFILFTNKKYNVGDTIKLK